MVVNIFRRTDKWNKRPGVLMKRRNRDKIKTVFAISQNITIIRIDYSQINDIEKHIIAGLNYDDLYYVSTPQLYNRLK